MYDIIKMENTNPLPSQIVLYNHTFFKCCTSWNMCKCSENLNSFDKRFRKMISYDVKSLLMYNKHQDYQAFKKKYPGISFGYFVSGKYL